MAKHNTFSRRQFIGATAALGLVGLSACATNTRQASRLWAADRTSGQLPPRGEFVVRNAYVVTMDPKLGDIANGDVHVRDGALVAIGPTLSAPGAEVIDGRILKHKGELVALDTEEVIAKAAESFHAARKRAGGPF